jgi:hypothetical protein
MDKFSFNSSFNLLILLTLSFALILFSGQLTVANGCAGGAKRKFPWQKEKQQSCMATFNVCSTAKITMMSYFMKESNVTVEPKFHFRIGIKNISDRPEHYKVSISLPEGPSSEGSHHTNGKEAFLEPGSEKVVVLPTYFDQNPQAITLKVERQWALRNTPIMIVEKCNGFIRRILSILQISSSPDADRNTFRTERIYCESAK